MSNYITKAKNPITGKIEDAEFLDDYYGKHQYGVRFADGHTYQEEEAVGYPRPSPTKNEEPSWEKEFDAIKDFRNHHDDGAKEYNGKRGENYRRAVPVPSQEIYEVPNLRGKKSCDNQAEKHTHPEDGFYVR